MGDMGVHLVDMVEWSFGPIARVCARAGIAYPSKAAPGASRPADAEDFCAVLAELASGTQLSLEVSRTAHGVNEHTLEAYGSRGAAAYRLVREGPRWYDGELRAATAGQMLRPVPLESGPVDASGDAFDVLGRTTIGPLVARLLRAIETGEPATPSLEDGLRAQAVLDAVAESVSRRAWVEVARPV
jgi:predicted dehydrogenase